MASSDPEKKKDAPAFNLSSAMAVEAGGNPFTHGLPTQPLHFPEQDHLRNTKTMEQVIKDAKTATDNEHNMTLWQGIKLYPKGMKLFLSHVPT